MTNHVTSSEMKRIKEKASRLLGFNVILDDIPLEASNITVGKIKALFLTYAPQLYCLHIAIIPKASGLCVILTATKRMFLFMVPRDGVNRNSEKYKFDSSFASRFAKKNGLKFID